MFQTGFDTLLDLALSEDLGPGDITTEPLVAASHEGYGEIVAKEELVLAGLDVACRVFEKLDDAVRLSRPLADGVVVQPGQTVLTIEGALRVLLAGERTALNFLQHLSGIATQARRYVDAMAHTSTRLVDTRKTTPGLRALEKYAVRVGGADNHRMGLYDGVLIKDNHIAAAGGVDTAVTQVRQHVSHLVKIEVEAADLDQVREALAAGADVIMLDNMDLDAIKAAVTLIKGQALVEVSGGVVYENLAALAATGVDLISVGALTHSARAVDLSMRIKKCD